MLSPVFASLSVRLHRQVLLLCNITQLLHHPSHPSLPTQTAQLKKSPSRHITKANQVRMAIPILSNNKVNLAPSKSASPANPATRTKRQSLHNQSLTLLFVHPSQHRSQFHSPNIMPHTAQVLSAETVGSRALPAAVLARTTVA